MREDCSLTRRHRAFKNVSKRFKRFGVSAELGVSPGMELTRMIPEKIQGATISYDWRTFEQSGVR